VRIMFHDFGMKEYLENATSPDPILATPVKKLSSE
jgi:hypothetical protein